MATCLLIATESEDVYYVVDNTPLKNVFKTVKEEQVLECPICNGNHTSKSKQCPILMEKKSVVDYSFTSNVPMRNAAELLKNELTTHTEQVPMVHIDSFSLMTPNQPQVEEINIKYRSCLKVLDL